MQTHNAEIEAEVAHALRFACGLPPGKAAAKSRELPAKDRERIAKIWGDGLADIRNKIHKQQ